jgi:uncharacterized oligopeptide transporter (OPT) family protein
MKKTLNNSDMTTEEILDTYKKEPEPRVFELNVLIVVLITGILGSIIGMELMVNLGISANTSIIGALIAVLLGMIPIQVFNKYKNVFRQNLIQTSISAATFTAGNVFMLALGTIWVYGEMSLIKPMIIGCVLGILIDILIMYKLFDTPALPASGTWPAGIATAETIISVVQGGKRALLLIGTSAVGAVGQFLGIPMDIFGVCWIGNIWALLMFGIGLIISGYSTKLFGVAIEELYIPHGIMIGAGVVALIQLGILLIKKKDNNTEVEETTTIGVAKSADSTIKSWGMGSILFTISAVFVAILSGIYTKMTIPMFVGWVLFTGLTSVVAEMLIGTAAMHAGWFPAMATSLIFLVLGMLLKFPPTALLILVGFKISTGPAFADMGYDLKTGWILRGRGKDLEYEASGQKQQYIAETLGAIIGSVVAILSYQRYFSNGQIPPVASVFATTIQAGTSPGILKNLLTFAIVGGIIQAIGGTKRQIGVLFATGLLIANPIGGITALVSLTIRVILEKKYSSKVDNILAVSAAGFIVGSSVFSFGNGIVKTVKKKSF